MSLRSGLTRLFSRQADAGLRLPKQAHSVALVGAPLSRGQVGIAAAGTSRPSRVPQPLGSRPLGGARAPGRRQRWLTRPLLFVSQKRRGVDRGPATVRAAGLVERLAGLGEARRRVKGGGGDRTAGLPSSSIFPSPGRASLSQRVSAKRDSATAANPGGAGWDGVQTVHSSEARNPKCPRTTGAGRCPPPGAVSGEDGSSQTSRRRPQPLRGPGGSPEQRLGLPAHPPRTAGCAPLPAAVAF